MENFTLKQFAPSNKLPSQSLFIEASAGTGKTYTIQLMVAKLISLGTPLKKILIVTYTEKAAGELKDRIRKKIDEVLVNRKIDKSDETEQPLSDAELTLFTKAYQDVDNAAIFTIHSFCQKALKEFAYDAGRPFDMSMIDDKEVNDLIEKFIRDNWSNDKDFNLLLDFEEKTSSFIRDLKEKFIKAINAYKGSDSNSKEVIPLDKIEEISVLGYTLSTEDKRKIAEAEKFDDIKKFPAYSKAFEILKGSPDHRFGSTAKKSIKNFTDTLGKWEKGASLYSGSEFKDGKYLQTNWQPDVYESFVAFKVLNNFLKNFNDILLNNFLIAQTPIVFDEWQKHKTDMKVQSFNDMILSVHQAVLDNSKGDSPLKTRLRAQYTYAIIDEFQDTNQLQWDIFSAVFDKIFVVGDPKQSIYSFQGADVNVYQKAIQEIKNGMSLKTNFRSTKGIIDGCNELFKGSFFTPYEGSTKLINFEGSLSPDKEGQIKALPQINGKEVAPIWISQQDIEETDFAQATVQKIVEWCSFVGNKTVLQVFDKKDCTKLRNVTFKDFAILARSRSEMEEIEDAMRAAGVPFSRYKDSNLFSSRECAEWIALFKAIDAPDFSAWNRRLLSEALITDFFRISCQEIEYVESEAFDDPENPVRKKINAWQELAQKRRYAEMLERIYSDTQIEERLTEISKLQNLAKLRQIGNYAVEYLYNHNCSLEDTVRHLEALASYSTGADDEDGNLIEKSTDYDAVQIMTIHASKGLEFPIVISVAGFKQRYTQDSGPFLYHDQNEIKLGFGDTARQKRAQEELEEWKRLFYVDFTRASSILILPRYKKWYGSNKVKDEFKFLESSIKELIQADEQRDSDKKLTTTLPTLENWDPNTLKQSVRNNILKPLNEKSGAGAVLTNEEIAQNIAQQKINMASLQGKIATASIMQFSYSTLSGKADSQIESDDGSNINPNGDDTTATQTTAVKISDIDKEVKNCTIAFNEELDYQTNLNETAKKFPRGSHAGNALHRIFENTKFMEFGEKNKTLEQALANPKTQNLIEEEFKRESLPIWNHHEAWHDIATRYTWNTLNARLPEIAGSTTTSETFALVDIPESDHKPEVQFNQNASEKDILWRFCKGFIDLLFVRPINGQKYYSILDWKSDMLENNVYTPDALKEKVDNDYSIQRVLYSYCLIQWLKQFYGEGTDENLSESKIFEKHFGGIYYAFIRGTEGGTSKGIYAQTWESYDKLEKAYQKVKKLMSKTSNKEGK
ncbi:UvrD-helicase domain-containing protein [Fibrobacter sp. UWB13]|uniref:UvrD-helicase domain-containing protein n=1 Tax=Fibrobacter sp. UWB13 TaxID=1896204 RepID=UPI000A09E6A8|nr:UvrD-helicase domain-containing protein [Fibrobacter sp. UWB13]SMG32918.1 exodeoxyribonuclease V beta subunit [Fibrobacter sp. UWB13]